MTSSYLTLTNKSLPAEIIIGRSSFDKSKALMLDFKNSGNIWIETPDNYKDGDIIDNFIVSYMFKLLEEFPLGKIRFYVLDKENKWCFKKFMQNMNKANANLLCKNVISIFDKTYDFLDMLKNKLCNEVSSKLVGDISSMYDLCREDEEESFKLIIVRNPLDTMNEEELNALVSLMKKNDTAHRCGLRFVTVYQKNKNDNFNFNLLNNILDNCDAQFIIEDGSFKLSDELISPLHIESDVIDFIDDSSKVLFDSLCKKGSVSIEYEDVYPFDPKIEKFDSSIIRIPVGKHGSKVFEIPFSSANEEMSPEGQCVNYMVIGSTGSGKSSFMHSVIINGARKYSPDDLRFWILDFKDGMESEKYRDADIPQIDLLSSKNTQNDAIYVLKMVEEECDKRKRLFSGCKDIHQFNRKRDLKGEPHLPHIIVIIDEAQELSAKDDSDGYSDNASVLNELIRKISQTIRAYGLHLVLIAQNLSSGNSSYISSFLSQANGRIAFALDENALAESGFGSSFNDMRNEITKLPTGSAYVGISGKLYRTRFAYAKNMEKYFEEIRNKYKKYSRYKTRVVGEVSKLTPLDYIPLKDSNYYNIISSIGNKDKCNQKAIIGENSYSLEPVEIKFNSDQKSSVLILGDSNKMSTSIFGSFVRSFEFQKNDIYLINCDKTSYKDEETDERLGNPLTKYCSSKDKLKKCLRPSCEIVKILEKIYNEYLDRKIEDSKSTEEIEFEPIYLLLNDVSKIDQLNNSVYLNSDEKNDDEDELPFNSSSQQNENLGDYFLNQSKISEHKEKVRHESKEILSALNELISSGYKMSIYVIVSMIGTVDRQLESLKDSFSRVIVYNNTNKNDIPCLNGNQRKVYDMLLTIKSETEEETRALYIDNSTIIKIRPVIYELSKKEREIEDIK